MRERAKQTEAKQEQMSFFETRDQSKRSHSITHATIYCLTTTQEVAVGDKAVAGDEAKETKK